MKQLNIDNPNFLAVKILNKLGISTPSVKQCSLVRSLLLRAATIQDLKLDERLTPGEIACLLLAAKGQSRAQMADLLGLTIPSVQTYRQRIKRKLNSSTLSQAVFEGMRLGYISSKKSLICPPK